MTMADQLDNKGEESHPADASTVESTRPNAEAVTATESASPADEFEDEPKVPVHVLIEARRKLKAAEDRARDAEGRSYEMAQRLETWDRAVPEIEGVLADRERLTRETSQKQKELEYLQRVAAAAAEAGLELPDAEEFKMTRLMESIAERLEKLEQMPSKFQSELKTFTSNYENQSRSRDQAAAVEKARAELVSKFETGWDSIVEVAPEIDDLRDVMFEKFVRDGGSKPVESYAGNLVKLAKSSRGRAAATKQAAASATRTSAVDGSVTSAPRGKSPDLPSSFAEFWKQSGL